MVKYIGGSAVYSLILFSFIHKKKNLRNLLNFVHQCFPKLFDYEKPPSFYFPLGIVRNMSQDNGYSFKNTE